MSDEPDAAPDPAQVQAMAPGLVEGLNRLFDEFGALGVQTALAALAPEAVAAFITGPLYDELAERDLLPE